MPKNADYNGFKLEISEISTLTFNRPGVNLFSTAVIRDFIKAVKSLKTFKGLRVLIIANEGRTWLAGADIREMAPFTRPQARRFSTSFHEAVALVEGLPAAVIAAVNGFCLGGGLELILGCDFVIASHSSVIGAPEINLGIIPGGGGTQRLPSRVGKLRAKELVLTGKRLSADEAAGIGLINKSVPAEKLAEEVGNLANLLAGKPPQCVRAAKKLIDSGTLAKEITEWSGLFTHEDQKRLMGEFLKKSR